MPGVRPCKVTVPFKDASGGGVEVGAGVVVLVAEGVGVAGAGVP